MKVLECVSIISSSLLLLLHWTSFFATDAYLHQNVGLRGILYQQNSGHLSLFLTKESDANVETISTIALEEYALLNGLKLKSSITAGIYLQIDAFPVDDDSERVGYLTAFIRPGGLLHLDTIQVKNRRQSLGFRRRNWTVDGAGMSFLMGSWAIKWGFDKGCRRTELLAVKDSDEMHQILIRLYQSFGFKIIREVGDGSESIADRLVWGAIGTLMTLDLTSFYKEWTPKFHSMQRVALLKQQRQQQQQEE